MEGLKNCYSACLGQVEKGEKSWADDFSNLDLPILSRHSLPVNRHLPKRNFLQGVLKNLVSQMMGPEGYGIALSALGHLKTHHICTAYLHAGR